MERAVQLFLLLLVFSSQLWIERLLTFVRLELLQFRASRVKSKYQKFLIYFESG